MDYTPIEATLRFRGGQRRETVASTIVEIAQDGIQEPTEEFILNVVPRRNVIVLTPVITVRIIGVGTIQTHTQTHTDYTHMHTPTHTTLHFIQQNDVSLLSGGCPTLPPIDNGDVVVSGLSTGDTATYTCSSGYQLEGEPTRTCQANGLWSSTAPICIGQIPSQPSDHSRILKDIV